MTALSHEGELTPRYLLLKCATLVEEADHVVGSSSHVGYDEPDSREQLSRVPLHLRDDPPRLLPGCCTAGKGMEVDLWLSGGPSNRPGHQVVYLPVEVGVRLEPYRIEDAFAPRYSYLSGEAKAASPLR